MEARIDLPARAVTDFCERYHVSRLALFGSVLREDFSPDSDVDVLIEFEQGYVPSLFQMSALEHELSDLFGRKVDLRTPAEISRYFRGHVEQSAQVIYDRA